MSEDRKQRTENRELGSRNAEGGNIRCRISNFRFGNAEGIKSFPQSTNQQFNHIDDNNDEKLEWIKLNCHAINGIRYV